MFCFPLAPAFCISDLTMPVFSRCLAVRFPPTETLLLRAAMTRRSSSPTSPQRPLCTLSSAPSLCVFFLSFLVLTVFMLGVLRRVGARWLASDCRDLGRPSHPSHQQRRARHRVQEHRRRTRHFLRFYGVSHFV